ncbi:MAG: flagellar hook-basal body complex protein FliE [Planctomycetes bacterium]|nr:flagellar hook-basal body complex protein FliE [Planctomycetota bacterium]
MNAFSIVQNLHRLHDIDITPNGGRLKDSVFRISHMGAQKEADMQINAFVAGEQENVHEVMISMNQAEIRREIGRFR